MILVCRQGFVPSHIGGSLWNDVFLLPVVFILPVCKLPSSWLVFLGMSLISLFVLLDHTELVLKLLISVAMAFVRLVSVVLFPGCLLTHASRGSGVLIGSAVIISALVSLIIFISGVFSSSIWT